MPLKVPTSVKHRLDQLDCELPRLRISSLFLGAQNEEGLTEDERKGTLAETAVFNLFPSFDELSVWGTHFGPLSHSSEIRWIDAEIVAHWQQRSKEAKHPVMRARYADAVWDLTYKITSNRPNVEYAHIACNAYLNTVDSRLHEDAWDAVDYARRSLRIALDIGHRGLIDRAKAMLLDLLNDAIANPDSLGSWHDAFDILNDLGNKRLALNSKEEVQIITVLEEILRRCSESSSPQFDPWEAKGAGERLARHYNRIKQPEHLKRVVRSWGQAFESCAARAHPILAMEWLQPVIVKYKGCDMKEDATRAMILSQEKGKTALESLRTIRESTTVSAEELNSIIDPLLEGDANESLTRIILSFIPSAQRARDSLRESEKKSPLSSLFSQTIVDEGRIVANAGTVDQYPDGRLIMQIAQDLRFNSQFLDIALGRAWERHKFDAEMIAAFLFASPAFDPKGRSTILEALKAYFAHDPVKFVYLAVPQIEQALRTLFDLIGQPINKPIGGAMDVKNLNDLLGEVTFKTAIHENVLLYLQALLTDRRGVNLRNNLCHGLLPLEKLTATKANLVLHALMTLSLLGREAPFSSTGNQ